MNADNYYNGATLFGFKSLNGSKDMEGLVFEVEAFAAFLRAKGLPLPEAWKRRFKSDPHPKGVGAPTEAGNPETVEPEAPSVAPDDSYEVAPGISLGEIRPLLARGSRYRSMILEALLFPEDEEGNPSDRAPNMASISDYDFSSWFDGEETPLTWILPTIEEWSRRPSDRRTNEALRNALNLQAKKNGYPSGMTKGLVEAIDCAVLPNGGAGGRGKQRRFRIGEGKKNK